MYVVGIREPDKNEWRAVCKTYSRQYALAVARKWRKRGCDTLIEEIQQDDEE
jgi:hypothetical protein